MEWIILHVFAVIFLATTVRSGFGFGEALIAVPLLSLVMPVEVAAPLAALVSITVAAVVVVQDWHKIHFRSAFGLLLSTFFGIPLGLWFIAAVEEEIVKGILAVSIIGFSFFCLVRRGGMELKDDRLAWFFGFLAGIFGGAYGMNGPPLVIYGSLRQWSPEHFRATLQGYFLPASIVGLCGYWLSGFVGYAVVHYYLLSLPVALLAIAFGRWINRRMNGRAFVVYVHAGLLIVGTVLLLQAIWNPLTTLAKGG